MRCSGCRRLTVDGGGGRTLAEAAVVDVEAAWGAGCDAAVGDDRTGHCVAVGCNAPAIAETPERRRSLALNLLPQYASAEVLPAHEYRFRDIGARVAQLEAHHTERSDEIVDALRRLADESTWEIAKQLTWSRGWDALNSHSLRMAVAETSSHLNLLREQGRVVFEGTAPARYRVAAND